MPRKKLKKCSNNEAIIQNLPISTNMKTEICNADEEHYSSDTFDESNFVPIDADEILGIKHESIDYEVETLIIPDAASVTSDFETSSISIKDEDIAKCEDFEDYAFNEIIIKSKDIICKECGKGFTSNKMRNRHYSEVHLKRNVYNCEICNKAFYRNEHLRSHKKRIHLKSQDYQCHYCKKIFSDISYLKCHERKFHLKKPIWKCNNCNKFFTTKGNLKNHNLLHSSHADKPKALEICKICNKSYRYLKSHNDYMHSDKNSENFKCIYCSKTFSTIHLLKKHEVMHSNVRNHKCKLCKKSFKRKSNLLRHEKKCGNSSKN